MANALHDVWMDQLLEMGFSRFLCEHAIASYSTFEEVLVHVVNNARCQGDQDGPSSPSPPPSVPRNNARCQVDQDGPSSPSPSIISPRNNACCQVDQDGPSSPSPPIISPRNNACCQVDQDGPSSPSPLPISPRNNALRQGDQDCPSSPSPPIIAPRNNACCVGDQASPSSPSPPPSVPRNIARCQGDQDGPSSPSPPIIPPQNNARCQVDQDGPSSPSPPIIPPQNNARCQVDQDGPSSPSPLPISPRNNALRQGDQDCPSSPSSPIIAPRNNACRVGDQASPSSPSPPIIAPQNNARCQGDQDGSLSPPPPIIAPRAHAQEPSSSSNRDLRQASAASHISDFGPKRLSEACGSSPKRLKTVDAPICNDASSQGPVCVAQYPIRKSTQHWSNWGERAFFWSRIYVDSDCVKLGCEDFESLGSLSSLYGELSADGNGGYSPWKELATSQYVLNLFDEAELINRLAAYRDWHYSSDNHWGTDMHVACEEESMRFRVISDPIRSDDIFSNLNDRMMFNKKAAIRCVIKDLRFVPNSMDCFFRSVRVPKNERNHPYDSISDPMITTDTKLVPPHNHNDPESEQPPGFSRFPLRPEQLRSLAWMRSREQNTETFKIAYEKLFRGWIGEDRLFDRGLLFSDMNSDYYSGDSTRCPWGCSLNKKLKYVYSQNKDTCRSHKYDVGATWRSEYGIDVKVEAEYPSRGGILADQLGYGKTATALGLIAFDTPELAQQELDSLMSSGEKLSYFAAPTTLILVPSNLLQQWIEQIAKFYLPQEITHEEEIQWRDRARRFGTDRGDLGCPKSVICFENISKLKRTTPEQLTKYDIVVCTCRIFWSQKYEKRREYLASCMSPDKSPLVYNEVLAQRRRTVSEETYALHRHLAQATECHYQTMEALNFPVLEQFFWRRIIYDESHEIEVMHTKVQRALTQMRAQFYWGLTGSPVLDTLRGLDVASMIMHVDLIGWDWKHQGWMKNARFREKAASFVQEFIRKNSETSYATIPMEERVIRVILQPEERALYLAQNNVCGSDKAKLIQLCSHFGGGESSPLDAMTEVDRVLKMKRKEVSKRTNSLQGLLSLCSWLSKAIGENLDTPQSWLAIVKGAVKRISSENAKQKVNQFVTDALKQLHIEKAAHVNPPEASVFLFLQVFDGLGFDWKQCKELSKENKALLAAHFNKRIRVAVEGYREALSAFSFFETTVAVLRNDSSSRSCPVCLEDNLELERIVVSSCGHVYCLACMDSVKKSKKCGVCRYTPLKDFSPIKPKEEEGMIARGEAQFKEYGSKIFAVYEKLLDIRREDPTAKVIMFTQYAWIRCKYAEVLEKFGMPFVTLKGTTASRGNIIDSFQNDPNSTAWILLMDLATSASGTHLTAANHVIFIHPMVSDSAATAAAYEKQAIGRCRRYGQTKVVKVWRFVASNTIEEDITELHQAQITQLAGNPTKPAVEIG